MLSLITSLLLLSAPETPNDPSVLMRQIWSPYCKGVSLMECPSTQAEKLRTEITARMNAGENFTDIYQDLTQRYGPVLRMSPTFEGREGLAYWIPWIVFAALSFFIVGIWMVKKKKPVRKSKPTLSKETEENLLREIKKDWD